MKPFRTISIVVFVILSASTFCFGSPDIPAHRKEKDLRECLKLEDNPKIIACTEKAANKSGVGRSPVVALAQSTSALQRTVPEDRLLVLLLNGKYEDLDQKLQILQKSYIADRTTENDIHKAFYEFYRADPRIGRALNEWIAQRPSSAMPYLARGIYRTKTGWVNRGGKWSSETSDSQFAGMAAWFDAAKKDLNQAKSIDPSLVETYCYLIEIDMNEGSQMTQTLFDQALNVNPSSFIAREFYLHSRLPRWGGSYEEMNETVLNAKPYYKSFPQLKALEGRVDADRGEIASSRKDYQSAIKYFDQALANGDFWFYNYQKGRTLWEIDDYQGALDQFSRVIRDKPGYKLAWWMRSQVYKMLNQFPDAIADMDYAINMEPNDDLAIAARGYIFQLSGNLKSALTDFRAAAKLNPTNASHQQAIANIEQLLKSNSAN